MEQAISFQHRIEPKFLQMFKEKKFFDCTLRSSNGKYNAHRIILAKQCEWFKQYLSSNQVKDHSVQEIEIPCDPNGLFPQFLKLLYSSQVKLTLENIASILKMASFYGCQHFKKILELSTQNFINKTTVLSFCNKFCQLDMPDESVLLSPLVAEELASIIKNPSKFHLFTKTDIYLSCNAQLMATILKDPSLKTVSEEEKLTIIDEFINEQLSTRKVSNLKFLTEQDREELASVFLWPDSNSNDLPIDRIIHHQCDWLPNHIYRHLVSAALDIRRSSLASFSSESNKITQNAISRWYPFSWLTEVRQSHPTASSPQVALVDLISTLGYEAPRFNPQPYGLISTYSSVPPVSKMYDAKNVFIASDDEYFLAHGNNNPAGIALDLGPRAKFVTKFITVDSAINKKGGKMEFMRVAPANLYFRAGDRASEAFTGNGQSIQMEKGMAQHIPITSPEPKQMFGITMAGPAVNGGSVLRIKSVELYGFFSPE